MEKIIDENIFLIDILEDVLGKSRNHYPYKAQMSFDCPVCSYEIKNLDKTDGKGNLEVNYNLGVFKCWACSETHNTHGTIYKLIKKFGTKTQLDKYLIYAPDYDHALPDKKIFERVKLPKEYISFSEADEGTKIIPHYKKAYRYLKGRNITDKMIAKHRIGFCYEGKYQNRIIIPSFDEYDIVNYFIARSYIPHIKKKYDNPEFPKEEIIWNIHLIDWSKPVYLVEGVFDHIFIPNSIPLLGKTISELLFDLLYDNAIEIIIVLDGDAWNTTEKLYEKLNGGRLHGKIWAIRLPKYEDVADIKGEINKYKKIQLHR